MKDSTNFNDVLVSGLFLTFILVLMGGCAYLVQYCGWSCWVFALLLFTPSIRTGVNKSLDKDSK